MLFLAEMLKNNVKLSKFYCKLKKTIYIYTKKLLKVHIQARQQTSFPICYLCLITISKKYIHF